MIKVCVFLFGMISIGLFCAGIMNFWLLFIIFILLTILISIEIYQESNESSLKRGNKNE